MHKFQSKLQPFRELILPADYLIMFHSIYDLTIIKNAILPICGRPNGGYLLQRMIYQDQHRLCVSGGYYETIWSVLNERLALEGIRISSVPLKCHLSACQAWPCPDTSPVCILLSLEKGIPLSVKFQSQVTKLLLIVGTIVFDI
jgi:hypothetical protein